MKGWKCSWADSNNILPQRFPAASWGDEDPDWNSKQFAAACILWLVACWMRGEPSIPHEMLTSAVQVRYVGLYDLAPRLLRQLFRLKVSAGMMHKWVDSSVYLVTKPQAHVDLSHCFSQRHWLGAHCWASWQKDGASRPSYHCIQTTRNK